MWQQHVAKVREKNQNLSYRDCLKLASKSYKKGGAKTPLFEINSYEKRPEDFKYSASDDLGDALFFLILQRNHVDCWLRDPETGKYDIKWDVREPVRYRLSVFGKLGGKTILKALIAECFKKSYGTFAVIKLTLQREGGGHRNYIIINLNTKEAFRYDPNGKYTNEKYKIHLLDDELTGLFTSIGFKYSGAYEACPEIGIQQLTDRGLGLCQIWAGLFVDTFLNHPKLSVEQVERLITDKFDTTEKLTDFVLDFSHWFKNAKKSMGLTRKKIEKKMKAII